MSMNLNSGYGKLLAEAILHKPKAGRAYLVATSSASGWDELSALFRTGNEGNTRVWGTLKGILDSGYIQDGGDDVIYVHPEHTESCNAAGDLDTGTTAAGLSIIGLGDGNARPLFTFGVATTADFNIGSTGVTVENCRFDLTGVDAVAAAFDVNDTGFTLRNCEVLVADADGQATLALLTDANAGKMKIDNCDFIGSQNAGTVSAIRIVGGNDHKILNSHFIGNYKITAGAIQVTTTAAGNVLVEGNTILNRTASSTTALDFIRNSTAVVVGNVFGVLSGSAPIHVDELATFGGNGSILTGRNYYKATTTPVAGTLL